MLAVLGLGFGWVGVQRICLNKKHNNYKKGMDVFPSKKELPR